MTYIFEYDLEKGEVVSGSKFSLHVEDSGNHTLQGVNPRARQEHSVLERRQKLSVFEVQSTSAFAKPLLSSRGGAVLLIME